MAAVDLFCGAGGLSYGLQQAGVPVVAGVDLDSDCRYAFETNTEASFLKMDVTDLTADHLNGLWAGSEIRVLVGCAPCQPFSPYRRGTDTSNEKQWPLLDEFGRLAAETLPDVLSMENVTRIGSTTVFKQFVDTLRDAEYHVDWLSCHGPNYGLPQSRRRLVLLASRLGPIHVPRSSTRAGSPATVREAIGELPAIEAGSRDPDDPLHAARALSDINMRRIRASAPGGTWRDWPDELRAACHRRDTGASFQSVYARMEWDKPSPTITTLAHNFGTGRFGHPEQDRPISLREAAMLQGFPRKYKFAAPGEPVFFKRLGRLIGNAVPPPLARAVGDAVVNHVGQYGGGQGGDHG